MICIHMVTILLKSILIKLHKKSLNLNKRISQHLNSKSHKSDKIRLRFNHIRYLVTRCELIALLIESQEIKRNRPILNKKLRKKMSLNIKNHIKKYSIVKTVESLLKIFDEK